MHSVSRIIFGATGATFCSEKKTNNKKYRFSLHSRVVAQFSNAASRRAFNIFVALVLGTFGRRLLAVNAEMMSLFQIWSCLKILTFVDTIRCVSISNLKHFLHFVSVVVLLYLCSTLTYLHGNGRWQCWLRLNHRSPLERNLILASR